MRSRILAPLLLTLAFAAVAAEAAPWSARWTARSPAFTPASQPGARAWVDTFYDPVAQRTVLFGGSGSNYRNDILYLSIPLNQWTGKEPDVRPVNAISPPCGRDEHAVEYDAFNRLYWSFGGSGYDCGLRSSTTQAGTTTTAVVDATLPATGDDFYRDWIVSVSGTVNYSSYVSGYDAAAKRLTLRTAIPTLAAGKSYTLRSQNGGGTWNYDPATRTWRGFEAPSFGYTAAKPPSRLSPAFAYSPADQVILMFGGATYNDTWALDAQTKTWVRMLPHGNAGSPPARAQMTNSMAYDPVSDVFVLFGGRCGDSGNARCTYNATLGDTWVYRLSTNTWTKMNPPQSPSPRQQHTMAFDPVNNVIVLFGGFNGTSTFNDVWVYQYATNTWTAVPTPSPAATPRRIHAMSYDPSIGEFVVYGGVLSSFSSTYTVYTLKLTDQGGSNTPPIARIAASPTSGSTATTFSLSGSTSSDADGSIVGYAWDFGDGTTGSGVNVTKKYASAGTYNVRLTVTDERGAQASSTVALEVAAAVDVTFSGMTLNGAVSNGTVTQIRVNGTPVSFTTGAGGSYSVNIPVTGSGLVTVVITATGAGGTTNETVTISVP